MAAALLLGCAAKTNSLNDEPPPQTVREVKELEAELGFEATPNFQRSGGETFEHCYYTGVFELPEDYSGLWFKKGRDGECRINERKYDVFFYAPEALAGSQTAVTPALEQAPPQRQTFVVAHEDFHDQPGVRALPAALKEAAATLAGFLVAWQQNRPVGQGEDTPAPAAAAFLAKAKLVNRSHDLLRETYDLYRDGRLSQQEALERKTHEFARLASDCGQSERSEAFSPCPSELNNAALAFEATYTRLYPAVFTLYEASGWDLKATLRLLKERLPHLGEVEENPKRAVERLYDSLRSANSKSGQTDPNRPK